MRSRLSANTPDSMPDMKKESASDRATASSAVAVWFTSMPSLFPAGRQFNQQLAHPPLIRRGSGQLQAAKDRRLSNGRHRVQLRQQQPTHRIDARDVPQLGILPAKILQPHRGVDAPPALAELLHHEPLCFAFAANLADRLLQDVLDRHQPGRAAEFIEYDRQAALLPLQALQQLQQVHAYRNE